MKHVAILICLLACAAVAAAMDMPSFHTKGLPTGKPTGPLKPGEYWWQPGLSPTGPVVALVSIPLQTVSVCRNGVLIGRSSVSTGAKGHSTPTGVFTILEKKKEHYSRTYDNAPMPNMQRLTWQGVAMHSGNLPGYSASHGCIRMPYDFSKLLFGITAQGGTVIIGNDGSPQLRLAGNPGLLLAPRDFSAEMVRPLAKGEYQRSPGSSLEGPMTLVLSRADRTVYVYRNGEPIGRATAEIKGAPRFGQQVFTLLEGATGKPSWWAPGQPGRKWMRVSTGRGPKLSPEKLGRIVQVNPEFASQVYAALKPGTTVLVTDEPMVRRQAKDFTIMTN
jgi:hypothetical protein